MWIAPDTSGHVRTLINRYGWNTLACQSLLPQMGYWFAPDGAATVGYVASARRWIAAGEPLCAPERLASSALAFAATARQQRQRACFFGAQERLRAALADQPGFASLLIGAQPLWDPQRWPELLKRQASLRAQIARARNKGLHVTPLPVECAAHDPELRQCLADWLHRRGLPPLHFLVEPDSLAYPGDQRVLVARRAGLVVGYLVALPIPQRQGWLVQQIVRSQHALNGTAELLVDATMRAAANQGATLVTLGFTPLAHLNAATAPTAPALVRFVFTAMRKHGQAFYNFAGLEAFRTRLHPEAWEPIYALCDEPHISVTTLYALVAAFGGSPPPRFLGRAVLRAAMVYWQECAMRARRRRGS
ncbi:MAG: phosphatidylglycerol lysyltransferase domain-containing protein [Oscillochloridaceae bacterium umkhey_bin13]